MNSLQFTFLCLAVLCLSSCVATADVIKFKGENATIKCNNVEERAMGVSLYMRHEAEMQVLYYDVKSKDISLRAFYEGRVEAKFDGNTLTVDILNLQMEDAGAYWCSCSVLSEPDCKMIQSGIFLVVRDRENEQKLRQAAPPSVSINGLLVPVVALSASSVLLLVLLVFGVWIVPKIKKMRYAAELEKGSANEVYEVMTVKR